MTPIRAIGYTLWHIVKKFLEFVLTVVIFYGSCGLLAYLLGLISVEFWYTDANAFDIGSILFAWLALILLTVVVVWMIIVSFVKIYRMYRRY